MNRNLTTPTVSAESNNTSLDYNYNAWRENYILTILRIACILGIGLIGVSFSSAPLRDRIVFPILLVILFGVTFLPVRYNIRAYTLIFINFAVGINGMITLGTWTDASIFLLVAIILSSLLLDANENVVILIVALVSLGTLAVLHQAGFFTPLSPLTPAITITDWAIYIADFAICSIASLVAITQLKQEFSRVVERIQKEFDSLIAQRSELGIKVRERTEELEYKTSQLQASTSVVRNIAEIQNIPDLLTSSVTATSEQFGFYHVGIYLLDGNKKNIFLQASSSAIGRELIGLGTRVDVDIKNPINIAIEKKRLFSATDIGGSLFIKDPNFPITRTRIAIPLSVRGNIIGVLDLHSDQVQTLNSEDIEIFQTLADLIAISIDNVRLLDETQTLIEQLKFYNAAQSIETWSRQTSRRSPAYQYTPAGVRPIFAQSRKEEIAPGTLSVSLTLQGQKIGAIKLRRKGFSASWSDKEKNMVEKIGEQISLALENSRLVEEAQRGAHRDQLIANISARIRETLDVDSVIRTASMELRKVFDLKEAEISVGLPQAEPRPVRKNTSTLRLK